MNLPEQIKEKNLEKMQLQGENDNIEHQIDMQNAEKEENGWDKKWYAKAKYVLKCRRRKIQTLMVEIAVLNKQNKRKEQETFERNFITAAKGMLDYETFNGINQHAHFLTES